MWHIQNAVFFPINTLTPISISFSSNKEKVPNTTNISYRPPKFVMYVPFSAFVIVSVKSKVDWF